MQNQTGAETQNPEEEWLSIGDAAELLGISRDTLRRWEKKGKVPVYRSPTDRRYYKKNELISMFSAKTNAKTPKPIQQIAEVVHAKTTTLPDSDNQHQPENISQPVSPMAQMPAVANPQRYANVDEVPQTKGVKVEVELGAVNRQKL